LNTYEYKAAMEVIEWKKQLLKKSGFFNRLSKKTQTKINSYIPEKAHQMITEAIKTTVKAVLTTSQFITSQKDVTEFTLEEKEKHVLQAINTYRKTATIEGAGTGVGGILLGLADFPMLLAIKMKFLYKTASLYGFDVRKYEERLFILHIFQLAYSSDAHRLKTLEVIENWDEQKAVLKETDWRVFQQEYRDYIDLVKMFQMIPGFGAVVGAYANYNLLERLGTFAMNAYRLRILEK
jgi:hypothetical protein